MLFKIISTILLLCVVSNTTPKTNRVHVTLNVYNKNNKHTSKRKPSHYYTGKKTTIQKTTAQNITPDNDETLCLAKNMYFEGRGEPKKGQLAIALVTLNRKKHPNFPNTICKVVYQKAKTKSKRLVAQFSWTLDKHSNNPPNTKLWRKIYKQAKLLRVNKIHDFTNGAMFFHAIYVNPYWAKKMKFLMQIKNHKFYKT